MDDELPELPRELWREIGRRNRSRLDVTRFRSVCRTWRSSLPRPIRFPLQVPLPPNSTPNDAKGGFHLSISETTFYAATTAPTAKSPSTTSIVAFEEEYQGGKFSASVLLHHTQYHYTKLALPKITQLSHLSFLANAYHIHYAFPLYPKIKKNAKHHNFYSYDWVWKTLVISSDSACSTSNPHYSRLCDLKVVAHLSTMKLAVLTLAGGAMKNQWQVINPDSTFQDIINYKGQLYAVNILGEAFVMDYNTLELTKVSNALPNTYTPLIASAKGRVLNLISDIQDEDDALYMFSHGDTILRYPRVYRLSRGGHSREWVRVSVKDLSHLVFVKDSRGCFAVERSLIRRHAQKEGLLEVPLVLAWPKFSYVRIAVGKNNSFTYLRDNRRRSCDGSSYVPFEGLDLHLPWDAFY